MKKYFLLIILLFPGSVYCQDILGVSAINLVFGLIDRKEIPLTDIIGTPFTKDEKKLMFKEIKELNIAIQNHPDSSALYINRGIILKELGVTRMARSNFEEALKRGSTDSSLFLYLGQSSFLEGARGAALQYLNAQIEMHPQDARAHWYKGIIEMYYQKSRFHSFKARCEASIPEFTEALNVNSKLKEALLLRGYAYQHLENHGAAIQDYQKLLSIYPDDTSIDFLLGKAFLDSGNRSAACEHFS